MSLKASLTKAAHPMKLSCALFGVQWGTRETRSRQDRESKSIDIPVPASASRPRAPGSSSIGLFDDAPEGLTKCNKDRDIAHSTHRRRGGEGTPHFGNGPLTR
eukprot:scaffold16436_cov126-Isochrysis_galbana.AAC.2